MLNSDQNSAEKSDQEVMKHMCKLCDKSFSCGRSLGGHMRSHVISSTDHDNRRKMKMNITSVNNNDWNSMNDNNMEVANGSSNSNDLCYELRKDPKKTLKAKDSNETFNDGCLPVLDKICKECGKGFHSWKALFGHMKCHSDKVSKTAGLKQDSWITQPDNENSGAKSRVMKKSRSRNGITKKSLVTCATTPTLTTTTVTATTASSSVSMNVNNASTSVVSDIDQDQEEEVALCLIMLSRDVGKWGKKITANGYKMKKLAETEVGFDKLEKTIINRDEFDDQSSRKFECTTCNKSFHTYQALGGHKASHKKLKGCFDSITEDQNSIKNEPMLANDYMIDGYCEKISDNHNSTSSFNLGGSSKNTMVLGVGTHECSICLKIFSSGQALGGHKRSHLIAEAKLNQQNPNLIEKFDKPVHELRGFFDLNMPPDSEDDKQQESMMVNTSTTGTGYNPWYYNHESSLLGLLSTS